MPTGTVGLARRRAKSVGPMSQRPRALARWLVAHGEAVAGPLKVSRTHLARANAGAVVSDRSARQWMLYERAAGQPRGFAREADVLRALARSGVPVPRVIGHDDGHCAVPFLLTTRIAGVRLGTADIARRLTQAQRHALGMQTVATLATLHAVEPESIGLPRPATSYLDRHLAGMTDAWARCGSGGTHDSAWRAVRARLIDRRPISQRPAALVHGDFRLANIVFGEGTVNAVIGWDLCTVGDPIADLAWLLTDWRSPNEPFDWPPSPICAGGFPTRQELTAAYQNATGFALHDLPYYRALAQWRAATLLQAQVVLHRVKAAAGDEFVPAASAIDDTIAGFLMGAAELLRRPR